LVTCVGCLCAYSVHLHCAGTSEVLRKCSAQHSSGTGVALAIHMHGHIHTQHMQLPVIIR
jgi:hypothetical protein